MGYSPWGCKESDTTKETEHARTGWQDGPVTRFLALLPSVDMWSGSHFSPV